MPAPAALFAAMRFVAPKAAAAALKYGPILAVAVRKNPQLGAFVSQATTKLQRPGDKITKLLEFGHSLAAAELAVQALPERQAVCRNWQTRMRSYDLALQQSKLKPRAAGKAARQQIAADADSTVTEIIETIAKWAEV